MTTLVDASLADHETVWAAAGHPHTVFPTTHDELVRITGRSLRHRAPTRLRAQPPGKDSARARPSSAAYCINRTN